MDFSGKWKNTKESVLELRQEGEKIYGTFDSGVADGGQVLKVPVVGWVNGDRLSFTTTYRSYGTVVAWVGQATGKPDSPVIDAHFLHESEVADEDEKSYLWASTRTGSDQFVKM